MNKISFLPDASGELNKLTHDFDWAKSPVGGPDGWPQSLRTIVSMILLSKFPMFLWWGENLVQFYNDAYRPSMGDNGKHPTALGQCGHECWPEIWPTIKPLIDQVKTTGEAIWNENQLIPIFRNGHIEDVYWTFGYSAVLDDSGEIGGVLVVCQEMTQMVIAKKQLEKSEARFRSIIEQAPLAIGLLSGIEMKIDVGNDSIFHVWGRDKSVKGMRLIDALPEIKDQGFIELLEEVYQTGEPYFGHSIMVKLNRGKGLEDVYFDFVYTPLRDENFEVTGVLILAIEVTEQVLSKQKVESSEARYKTLSRELEEQVQQRTSQLQISIRDLKRSNENLQQFAYVASHDLQEPLRKIQAFGDLLRKHFPEDLAAGADYLDRMQSAALRMSALINDLLSYSRIPGPQSFTKTVSIDKVVELVLVDLELLIEQTGATIEIGQLPEVKGDASQLGQLFQNLLSNALKFRRADVNPIININAELISWDHLSDDVKPNLFMEKYYKIDVSDNGVGFDNKHRTRIFQVFQRLHGKTEFAGSGIGLSICDKIASNHCGTISANGHQGVGATFSVYLPVTDIYLS